MIWGNSELLDGHRDPLGILYRCLHFWKDIPDGGIEITSYKQQEQWAYYPGYYNLALLHLFGLIDLQLGEPEPAKGWRMVALQRLPWGDAVMGMLAEVCRKFFREGEAETLKPNLRIAFEKLKPYFTPFFPEWQKLSWNCLTLTGADISIVFATPIL